MDDMTPFTFSGTLTPTAPFDFTQTLKFLGMFMPAHGEQTTTGDVCIKALPINGQAVVARVTSEGTIEQPKIIYTFYAANPLTDEEKQEAIDRVCFYLSLDDDLRAF